MNVAGGMWEAFALHHGVPVLPAELEHVAPFVREGCRTQMATGAARRAQHLDELLPEDLGTRANRDRVEHES